MVNVQEALNRLSLHPLQCESEEIHFEHSLGRILAAPILADRDFPPYDRVAMDGIALSFDQLKPGKRFLVEKTIAAGQPKYQLQDPSNCVEIMTGAVLPDGCDTVVRYEDVDISDGVASISVDIAKGQSIHWQGSDRKAKEIIVPVNKEIGAPEIGIAATVGKPMLEVWKVPAICLVSTGDELVPVGGTPELHQIRSSNAYVLRAALRRWHTTVDHEHLADDEEQVRAKIKVLLKRYQILIFIGGSSAGKYDFIPETLKAEGVEEHFYKIKQRPGKPMWFGSVGDRFVFALPGNPVSCFLCLKRYFDFWLEHSLGILKGYPRAILSTSFEFHPSLTYFLQVTTEDQDGSRIAHPVAGGGSGDHANLSSAEAFLELPEDREKFEAGASFLIHYFR